MERDSENVAVHETNEVQADSWDGEGGEYWAAHADRFDRAIADYQGRFEAEAAIHRGENVLDVGCGGGLTTRNAARASVDGEVLGIDLSSRLLDVARARAADLDHVRLVRGDAQVHPFEPEHYDVVVSGTGVMFFGDPVAAFANLRAATRAGGRMVVRTWQPPDRNEWISGTVGVLGGSPGATADLDAPGMFALSRPERVRQIRGDAGGLFAWLVEKRTPDEREAAFERLRESVAAHAGSDGVEFGSSAWLITARRGQP